jgi:hypothetical protein
MTVRRLGRVLVLLAATSALIGAWASARSDSPAPTVPTLELDTSQPGSAFAPGAVGLSTEAFELSSGHLSAEHPRLVRLMRMLGPSVLRVGGNSVDMSWWTSDGESAPAWASNTVTPADLSTLSGLLGATGWRVLLGVDLGHFEPARVADEARYAKSILGSKLLGIEVGNEPDDFGRKEKLRPPTYSLGEYLGEAEAYGQALAATGVSVFGPAFGRTEWLTQMGVAASMFSEITLHYYPTSACADAGSGATSKRLGTELLLPDVRQQEEETIEALVRAGSIAARPTRIGETNTAACPISPSAGPVFASALWALDWSLRAASHGVSGMNFHSDLNACGLYSDSPICASDEQAAHAGDVMAQPEYYGLLAAHLLEDGRFIPARLSTPSPLPNLTIWATLAPDRTVRIAIDNLATEGSPQPIAIPASGYLATSEALIGSATERGDSGVSLGGAAVTYDGFWQPRRRRLQGSGSTVISVPAESAVIVTLRPRDR